MWHEFRIIDRLVKKWEAKQDKQDGDPGKDVDPEDSGILQEPPPLKSRNMR